MLLFVAASAPCRAVDLGDPMTVTHLVIYNRADCCQESLMSLEVRVGAVSPSTDMSPQATGNAVCWARPGVNYGGIGVLTISCSTPLVGRYVSVQRVTPPGVTPNSNGQAICEVRTRLARV